MKISQKEIESICKLAPFDRYIYFIKRVADFEIMYTLVNESRHLALSEIEGKFLLPFWSAQAFAELNIEYEWQKYTVKKVTLQEFEDDYIDLIIENKYLLNIFPINNKTGFVVDVDEFARDLANEMQKYS